MEKGTNVVPFDALCCSSSVHPSPQAISIKNLSSFYHISIHEINTQFDPFSSSSFPTLVKIYPICIPSQHNSLKLAGSFQTPWLA